MRRSWLFSAWAILGLTVAVVGCIRPGRKVRPPTSAALARSSSGSHVSETAEADILSTDTADSVHEFAIASGPAGRTLHAFTEQANVALVLTGGEAVGRITTAPVHGRKPSKQALDDMLKDKGLIATWSHTGVGDYVEVGRRDSLIGGERQHQRDIKQGDLTDGQTKTNAAAIHAGGQAQKTGRRYETAEGARRGG
jgi:hypothetical protein